MGFFDVPHSGYGTHPNPVMIFGYVHEDDMNYLKARCNELDISFERWFVGEGTDLHESLDPGVLVYYPQYNCVRNANHMDNVSTLGFVEFFNTLRKHPKNIGSFFLKTPDVESRDIAIKHFEGDGYRLFKSVPTFDFELSLHINAPSKFIVTHSNRRADENEREGYPVMTYDDFKIYMQ